MRVSLFGHGVSSRYMLNEIIFRFKILFMCDEVEIDLRFRICSGTIGSQATI